MLSTSMMTKTGILLKVVIDTLVKFAPLNLAESWDNVGLLVEPADDIYVKNILLTNDLTEDVLKEAIVASTDLIVSYHPIIFPNLKCINNNSWKQRIISKCLANRIAIFSPHTTWDIVKGGVNDWLISAFDVRFVKPITPSKCVQDLKHLVTVDGKKSDFLKKLIESENLSSVCYRVDETEGSFTRFIIHCKNHQLRNVTNYLVDCSDVLKYNIIRDESPVPEDPSGVGRICELIKATPIKDVIGIVKQHLNLSHIQIALAKDCTLDTPIKTIAVCAGSGGSVLREVVADLKLTGEASHHDVLDAVHKGSSYILTQHSNSERGFLNKFKEILGDMLQSDQVNIIISKQDHDPLSIV